ncbi:MAG: hypothetical protein A3H42_04095, partial [Deltaproteobacteria bacterium RIFCSPLOWO2_02_FULL_46_8]
GGLSSFVENLKDPKSLKSVNIPHFPKPKAEGHAGEVIFGNWNSLPVAVLKGRSHFYEGLTPQEVVYPYFVLNELGAKLLVTTNAVGGIRSDLEAGDIMVVEDQINMMGTSPLIGLSVQRSENQFLSMQKAFDPELIALTESVAKKQKIKLKRGVFLGTTGPNYETPAEIKAFRNLGADSIGMSTVFEVIAARFLKLRVLALNIITNPSADRHMGEMKHSEVLSAMQKAEAKVLKLLEGIFNQLCQKI